MSEKPSIEAQALESFIAKKKFEPEGRYPGTVDEAVRNQLEGQINALAERLLKNASSAPLKERVLGEFKAALPAFEIADSEERAHTLDYLVEIMDIYGIESSDGLLNTWFYGFDPSQSAADWTREARAAMSKPESEFAALLDQLTLTTAVTALTQALGEPTAAAGPTYMWISASDPNRAVAVSTKGDKTTLIWMNKGQFVYSRDLQ